MLNRFNYRVPFSETDAMGIVHHSNYARYFERGRIEFLRELGRSYSDFVENGFHFPVLNINTIFRKPAKFDDVLVVETSLREVTKTRLSFAYKIFSKDGGPVLTEGNSEHCCVNSELRPVAIPEDDFNLLTRAAQERGV